MVVSSYRNRRPIDCIENKTSKAPFDPERYGIQSIFYAIDGSSDSTNRSPLIQQDSQAKARGEQAKPKRMLASVLRVFGSAHRKDLMEQRYSAIG